MGKELIPIVKKHPHYEVHEDYPGDIDRIQEALECSGRYASREDCEWMWRQYSDSMAAGWLILPDTDEEILRCISYYYE